MPSCSHCGAALASEEGRVFVSCRSCHTLNRVGTLVPGAEPSVAAFRRIAAGKQARPVLRMRMIGRLLLAFALVVAVAAALFGRSARRSASAPGATTAPKSPPGFIPLDVELPTRPARPAQPAQPAPSNSAAPVPSASSR